MTMDSPQMCPKILADCFEVNYPPVNYPPVTMENGLFIDDLPIKVMGYLNHLHQNLQRGTPPAGCVPAAAAPWSAPARAARSSARPAAPDVARTWTRGSSPKEAPGKRGKNLENAWRTMENPWKTQGVRKMIYFYDLVCWVSYGKRPDLSSLWS